MKVQTNSTLPNNRSSFLPRKRASPTSSDSGFASATECQQPKQQGGSSLAGMSFPRRPPLRRTTHRHIVSSDHGHRSSSEAIAFERELQNLLEVEYRDDVQEYMYEMEVRSWFCFLILEANIWTDAHTGTSRAHRPTTGTAMVHATVSSRLPHRNPPATRASIRDALPRHEHCRPLRGQAHRLQEALPAGRMVRFLVTPQRLHLDSFFSFS